MSERESRVESPASSADEESSDSSTVRSPVRAYVQLLRLPAVFTALADIFLGYMLTHASLTDAPVSLGSLLATSACLYLAGMVFNDVFDRRVDAVERPQRPIPSGRVSLRAAVILGAILMIFGLVAAASLRWVDPLLCGWNPLFVAALLVAAILLYDGWLNSTPLGSVAMGSCRFLNVILGASASGFLFGKPFYNPQRWIAAGLAIYVAGVTWFSRSEAQESRRGPLIGASLVINAGLLTLLAWVWRGQPGPTKTMPLLLLAFIALTINKRILTAISNPSPAAVQATVRTLLLSIITIDAAMIFAKTNDIVLATGIAAGLLVPALLLGRLAKVT